MNTIRITQAGAVVVALLLGSAASAADYQTGGTSEVTKTSPQQERTARAGGSSSQQGQTSGPAEGTNVKPSQGVSSSGEAGVPGYPGNKSGPAVIPPKDQKQQQSGR